MCTKSFTSVIAHAKVFTYTNQNTHKIHLTKRTGLTQIMPSYSHLDASKCKIILPFGSVLIAFKFGSKPTFLEVEHDKTKQKFHNVCRIDFKILPTKKRGD